MASYHYYNGVYGCTTFIRNNWHRFHTMNAQYQYGKFANEYHVGHYQERFDFISYATPIAHVLYDSFNDHWTISVNRAYFDCSPSTSRQFSRWMRENNIPVSLYDLKHYDTDRRYADMLHHVVNDNVDMFWADSATLERMY